VNRTAFKDGEEFRDLVTNPGGSLLLEIETAGRLRTVEVPILVD
jgi:hypothetical protein